MQQHEDSNAKGKKVAASKGSDREQQNIDPDSAAQAQGKKEPSPLSLAFFAGMIKDTTTKESRKAAEDLAIIQNKIKNLGWKPVNTKVASLCVRVA